MCFGIEKSVEIDGEYVRGDVENEGSVHPLVESERGLPTDVVVVESEVELLIANVNVEAVVIVL